MPIWEVPDPVVLAVSAPRLTAVPVALAQLELVMPDVPVQNVSVSSTDALSWIWLAVLDATVPVSMGVVNVASEYVVMRA